MNRQEAVERLMAEVSRIEEIMENGEAGCVDMDTWNEFAKKAEWRETLIELLTGPTPDPITGLVPCGCGGKTQYHYGVMSRDKSCYVQCETCGQRSGVMYREEGARKAWNTAMGWKGGAE